MKGIVEETTGTILVIKHNKSLDSQRANGLYCWFYVFLLVVGVDSDFMYLGILLIDIQELAAVTDT